MLSAAQRCLPIGRHKKPFSWSLSPPSCKNGTVHHGHRQDVVYEGMELLGVEDPVSTIFIDDTLGGRL